MGSNLNIFKIGVGPSSSHTVGPMIAGNHFCKLIESKLNKIAKIKIELYGSLSLTGKGHLTDVACIIGLNGIAPNALTPDLKESILDCALKGEFLMLAHSKQIPFFYKEDVVFYRDFLPLHENGMRLSAFDESGDLLIAQVYYSIGGGFIATKEELENPIKKDQDIPLEFDFSTAKELLALCERHSKSIAEISMEYEMQFNTAQDIEAYCLEIWEVMKESYRNGCNPHSDILPGSLKLKRRAPELYRKHQSLSRNDPLSFIDDISLYAIAIAEENGAGGKVVTAPTNGACAVVPAVMLYLEDQLKERFDQKAIVDFLLTAMAIGSLYKKNASISGAEAGCQAEIGSASSMAAAAMAMILGANNTQVCSAAEIAMEHHLGLTCDPVAGLVQIPCIERNAFGAIKAVSSARMAMSRESAPKVGLDEVILTMYQTGKDMDLRYKETSLGGLAKTFGSVC